MKRDECDLASSSELLAAFADGGLDGAERESVEAHLAADPAARDEVLGMRAVIAAVRALPLGREPAWGAMAARIRDACAEAGEGGAPRGALERLRAWLTPLWRPRWVVAVAAVAAVVLGLGSMRGGESLVPAPVLAPLDVPASERDELVSFVEALTATADGDVDFDVDDAGLEELASSDVFGDVFGDELLDEELLEISEWAGRLSAPPEPQEIDVLGDPDYERWLEQISDEEVEALLDYLQQAS